MTRNCPFYHLPLRVLFSVSWMSSALGAKLAIDRHCAYVDLMTRWGEGVQTFSKHRCLHTEDDVTQMLWSQYMAFQTEMLISLILFHTFFFNFSIFRGICSLGPLFTLNFQHSYICILCLFVLLYIKQIWTYIYSFVPQIFSRKCFLHGSHTYECKERASMYKHVDSKKVYNDGVISP